MCGGHRLEAFQLGRVNIVVKGVPPATKQAILTVFVLFFLEEEENNKVLIMISTLRRSGRYTYNS